MRIEDGAGAVGFVVGRIRRRRRGLVLEAVARDRWPVPALSVPRLGLRRIGPVRGHPARPDPREAKLRSYHAKEAFGVIWVCLGDESRYGPHVFPEFAN